jgi:hypothetical protein
MLQARLQHAAPPAAPTRAPSAAQAKAGALKERRAQGAAHGDSLAAMARAELEALTRRLVAENTELAFELATGAAVAEAERRRRQEGGSGSARPGSGP